MLVSRGGGPADCDDAPASPRARKRPHIPGSNSNSNSTSNSNIVIVIVIVIDQNRGFAQPQDEIQANRAKAAARRGPNTRIRLHPNRSRYDGEGPPTATALLHVLATEVAPSSLSKDAPTEVKTEARTRTEV